MWRCICFSSSSSAVSTFIQGHYRFWARRGYGLIYVFQVSLCCAGMRLGAGCKLEVLGEEAPLIVQPCTRPGRVEVNSTKMPQMFISDVFRLVLHSSLMNNIQPEDLSWAWIFPVPFTFTKESNWFDVLILTLSFFGHGGPKTTRQFHLFTHERLRWLNQHTSCRSLPHLLGLINPCLCLGHFNSCMTLSLTHDLLL